MIGAATVATICVAQILAIPGVRDGNLVRIDHAAAKCKALGADLAVFPEAALLGWDNPAAWNRSAPIPGADTDALGAIAQKHGLTMVVGLAERVNATTLHDSAVLIDGRDGALLGVHRKVNILGALMDPPYVPGSLLPGNIWAIDTACCGKVGVLICADTFREDVVAAMAATKPDIVAVPYGWSGCPADPDPPAKGCPQGSGMWPRHGHDLVARVQLVANATGAAVAGADSVGQQSVGPWAGQTYGGWSPIAVPRHVLAVAADRDVDVQVATVTLRSRTGRATAKEGDVDAVLAPAVAKNGTFQVTWNRNVTYAQGLVCGSLLPGRPSARASKDPKCNWTTTTPAQRPLDSYQAIELKLDVYEPVDPPPGKRPPFLCVHGGGYVGGDDERENCNVASRMFASAGFVAFTIDYRLSEDMGNVPRGWPNTNATDLFWMPQNAYPALRDAKSAVRYIRANAEQYNVDPDYLVAYGGSAGGCTVVALGLLHEKDYKTEITAAEDPTLATTHLAQSSAVSLVLDHWGSDYMAWRARHIAKDGLPLYAKTNPPLAVFHGTLDPVVPFKRETGYILGGYNSTGVPYAFYPLPGKKHGPWGSAIDSCIGPACAAVGAKPGDEIDLVAWDFVVQQLGLRVVGP